MLFSLRNLCLLFFFSFGCSIICCGQTPNPEVKAEAGDGIFSLLREHSLDPSRHLATFIELNKENLGEDSSLYVGRTYILPQAPEIPTENLVSEQLLEEVTDLNEEEHLAPSVVEYPLFGKNYAKVVVKDQELKGAVFHLVSGHGGPDPGAIGKYGAYQLGEDEYAYDVTIRLARNLVEHGATVYMIVQDENDGIREGSILELDIDEVCYLNEEIPLDHGDRLRQRTKAINNLYLKHKGAYQRMLAIHVDSRSRTENIDVFFYHHKNSPMGKKLAEAIHNKIDSKYNRHQPNRDYFGSVSHRSSLYVVKYSYPPTVFIELGNIKNNRDQRRFVLPDNRQALANWICEGIIADYKAQ